ncbi:MAG: non-ribosomal peptide synthetase, partial [Acidobacteria bacterium]
MSKNPDPPDRVGDLSPERRAILMRMLRDRTARSEEAGSIPRRPAGDPPPLSFAQHRLWFLDRLAPGAPTYNMARAVRLRGRLDRQALGRALDEIIRRHEILRTTFVETPVRPVQIIAPTLAISVPVVECGALPADRQAAEIGRRAAEVARRPFDLARGPLVRVVVLRLADDDQVLVLTMHHIVGDGWSIGLFDRELAVLYSAFSCGRPSPLPEPAIQYADFAHWQRLWLQGDEPQRLLEFWRARLQGAPPVLGLPLDRPRPPAPTYGGGRVGFVVPADRTLRLKELARGENATPFMVLLATFQALLGRLTGQDDLCVGTPVAGRTRLETEPLIGVFVNTLVLRADLSGDPTFAEHLRRVRRAALESLARQDLPFEKIVEALRPGRDPSVHPLFQAMFVLQDGAPDAPALPGLQAESVDFEIGSTPFDLTLIVSEQDGAMEAVLEYSTDLFDRSSIERMARQFEVLLEAFLADPARRPSAIPLPGLAEASRPARDPGGGTVA